MTASSTTGPSARHTSPLADWSERFAALPVTVSLLERPFLSQLNLRVDPMSATARAVATLLGVELPTRPNTWVETAQTHTAQTHTAQTVELLALGPDEWLLVGRYRSELEAQLRAAGAAVTDVSAQRTRLDLSGPAAADVLAQGCAIDFDPGVTPFGSCVQTLLARSGIIILVRDHTAASFSLLVRSSFAAYVADWLIDACADRRDDPA